LVREQVWLEVCQASFDSFLGGLSRVRKCTNEGRASMTMDAAVLHNNLNSIHPCRPPRGRHYIDAFIQASYMSEEEMLTWIRENYQTYAYRHLFGLLTQTLSSVINNKKLKDATAMLDQLYDVDSYNNSDSSKGAFKLGSMNMNMGMNMNMNVMGNMSNAMSGMSGMMSTNLLGGKPKKQTN
jgi:hypothetical protein